MRGSSHRALLLRPLQSVQPERRPVLAGISTRKHLLLEPQQHEMSALVRAKAAHLDVVTQQVRILRNLVDAAAEKLLLKIEARPPSEIRADFEIFAFAMPKHVLSEHALRWFHV